MKRRSFLKSVAAALPAGFPFTALAQASSTTATARAHLIPAGQDRFDESHSRGFSSILFKVMPSETNAGLFLIEHAGMVMGGPPLHLHLHQEEYFYVIDGEVLFQVGDERKRLGPGDSILGPRNIPHTFSAAAEKPSRMLIAFTPAGKMEEFLRATAVPNPPVQDAAFFRRYEMELIGPSPLA